MDKLISQLGATAGVVSTDVFEIEKLAGPPSEKATIAQLVTLLNTLYAPITGGAYVLKAGDTMTGRLIITQATANTSVLTSTGYSLTGANAQSLLDLAGTWNTSGNPNAINLVITNTASGGTSNLLRLATSAATQFIVTTAGRSAGDISSNAVYEGYFTQALAIARTITSRGWAATFSSLAMSSGFQIGWTTGSGSGADGGNIALADVSLFRDSAGVLAERSSTTAQTFRLYRTFTDLSNYERLALQTAAGQMIIAAETAGTGTDDLDLVLTPAGVGRVTLPGGAQLLKTTAAMTSGAAAGLGTLSNSPTAGNPAVWCPIMFNGVQHWFPCWT